MLYSEYQDKNAKIACQTRVKRYLSLQIYNYIRFESTHLHFVLEGAVKRVGRVEGRGWSGQVVVWAYLDRIHGEISSAR